MYDLKASNNRISSLLKAVATSPITQLSKNELKTKLKGNIDYSSKINRDKLNN